MRYKKIPKEEQEQHEALKELGCLWPGETDWYSYTCSEVDEVRVQSCVNLFSSIKPSAAKKYQYIQHFSRYANCEKATEVLCVRQQRKKNYLIVVAHPIGKCPVCKYHTRYEYDSYLETLLTVRR